MKHFSKIRYDAARSICELLKNHGYNNGGGNPEPTIDKVVISGAEIVRQLQEAG
jgi:hypothetical protein